MKELKCEQCGTLAYALVNGYVFGDRILEGVMFRVFAKGRRGDDIGVDVDEEFRDYFATLNQKKWLAEARRQMKSDPTGLVCPSCEEEIVNPWAVEAEDAE